MTQKKTKYVWVTKGNTPKLDSSSSKPPCNPSSSSPKAPSDPGPSNSSKPPCNPGSSSPIPLCNPSLSSPIPPCNPSSSSPKAPSDPGPSNSSKPPCNPGSSSPIPRYSGNAKLSNGSSYPTMDQKKTNYIWVEKGRDTPNYKVPKGVKALIRKDIVPEVLKKPLSPSTYKDFFRALLYAEDCYLEKWDGFEMENVTLELEDAAKYKRKRKNKNLTKTVLDKQHNKVFVAFEMDSVPMRRPFLLSRDFAYVRPSGSLVEPFQGTVYRVVKSNHVLVEFGEDFHSQYKGGCKYDVKFSLNRVCLKRAHHAIDTVSDCLFDNFLFPTSDCPSEVNMVPSLSRYLYAKLDGKQHLAVSQICSRHGPPPYLVQGPLCVQDAKQLSKTGTVQDAKQLSKTGTVIYKAILHLYRTNPDARILICAPTNATCDMLVKSLGTEIPESAMFRANAAFREMDEVLLNILPSCRISGDCFSCPLLEELEKFKVVSSTYVSCFRLRNEGLLAGHFSQMFMLDASSTTEPEVLVALAHFAHESTDVVVTGARRKFSRWVRSPMARRNGLLRSYFKRLYESKLYADLEPKFVSEV